MARTKKTNEPKQETLEPQAHAEVNEAVNEPMLPAWEQKYQKEYCYMENQEQEKH